MILMTRPIYNPKVQRNLRYFRSGPIRLTAQQTTTGSTTDTTFGVGGTSYHLTGIELNTPPYSRHSDKVQFTGFAARSQLKLTNASRTDKTRVAVYIFIVVDSRPDATILTLNNVYRISCGNPATAMIEPCNRDRYRTLGRQKIEMWGDTNYSIGRLTYDWRKYFKFRVNTDYKEGTSGDLSNIQKGAIYLYIINKEKEINATLQWTMYFHSRVM